MVVCEGNPKIHPHELTPRDDVKKIVSEVLKRVDFFIRKGELDQAELCVIQAREIDPKNIYAFAFQERIAILKEQANQNFLAAAACKAAEEVKRTEGAHGQTNQTQSQKEQPKFQPKPQPVPQAIPHKQPEAVTKRIVEPVSNVKLDSGPDIVSVVLRNKATVLQSTAVVPQGSMQEQADAQRKFEEERNLKIQRMIKIAIETARREIEAHQMEIRSREREEFARREQVKIKEAADAARIVEEQRQTELRKTSEEQLQQKIKDAFQRKPVIANLTAPMKVVPDSSTAPLRPDRQISALAPTESPLSAERLETLERYKLVLSSVWTDGAVSEEEASTLNQLRQSLAISVEEHTRLEKNVQRDTYTEALKKAWNSGAITPENASVLAELRQRFQISTEEHLAIESRIFWELQPVKNRPTLLVIDDDERLLKVVSKTLNDAGFFTTPVTTSDEAYAYLQESSPDLILCDVNLETSTMGGFAFYEKVREFERLRETPFIFLSGLTDETLVRTGKELGVDDYLSKPVSEETLVATIKGKLRRYQELKKRMN